MHMYIAREEYGAGCITSLANRYVVPTEQSRADYHLAPFPNLRSMPHIIFAKNTACRAAKLSHGGHAAGIELYDIRHSGHGRSHNFRVDHDP